MGREMAELPEPRWRSELGRPLGHFIFSLRGLKRILFLRIFFRGFEGPTSSIITTSMAIRDEHGRADGRC